VDLLGVIPESQDVLKASNQGTPVILNDTVLPVRPMKMQLPVY